MLIEIYLSYFFLGGEKKEKKKDNRGSLFF